MSDAPWEPLRTVQHMFPKVEWDAYVANRRRLWEAGIRAPSVLTRVGFDTEATEDLVTDLRRLGGA